MKNSIYSMLTFVFFNILSCANSKQNTNSTITDSTGVSMGIIDTVSSNWNLLSKGDYCTVRQERQIIIETEEKLNTVWKSTFNNVEDRPERPQVDFSKHWVFAAYLGEVPSAGYSIDVHSITQKDSTTIVTLNYIQPGENCFSAAVISQPYIFVEVKDLTSKNVRFEPVIKKEDCK